MVVQDNVEEGDAKADEIVVESAAQEAHVIQNDVMEENRYNIILVI